MRTLQCLDNFIARTMNIWPSMPIEISSAVMELYFAALQWTRLVETFGDHSLYIDEMVRAAAG